MRSPERILWSVPKGLPGVEVLTVANNRQTWCVYHQTYTLCNLNEFTVAGDRDVAKSAEWIYRSRLHMGQPGTIMLLEPGELHRNTKNPFMANFDVLLIDPELVGRTAQELGMRANPHFRGAATSDPGLYRAFVRFHAALAQETSLLHRQSLLMQCIGSLLSAECEQAAPAPGDAGRRKLRWARDYLVEHACEEISLEQLASLSQLSRFHFLRMFTREFGLPPHAYQIRLRIERVRQLLRLGFPLRSIDAGFADQSHLIRHFKKAMGVTPGEYAATTGSGPRALNAFA